jgi:hypothetical protein
MLLRNAPAVGAQPSVVLIEWRVFAFGSAVILAGVLANGRTLRVTTPVRALQPATRTWTTSSGRIYQTPNPPASDEKLRAVLDRFAQVHAGTCDVADVTEDFWRRIRGAAH